MAWENVDKIKIINDTYFSFLVLDYGVYGLPTTGTKEPAYGLPNDSQGNPTYANGAAVQFMCQDAVYRGAVNFQNPAISDGSVTFKGGGRITWTRSGAYITINFIIAGCRSYTYSTTVVSNQATYVWLQVDWAAEKANIGIGHGNIEGIMTHPYRSFRTESLTSDADLLFRTVVSGLVRPDPYERYNNNYEQPIGGGGNHDETSDTIAEGSLPTIGGNTSGFCTAYVPTLQQINDVADRLIDPAWYQVLGNTVLDLSQIIIGLSIFPFAVPKVTSSRQVRVNVVGAHLPLGVYIDKADGQYHEINCGSLDVKEFWGNCLDYNPYTKVSIYLPFCGFYELDTDDVMNKTIQVKYRIDIMTGTCLASIIVGGSVMYQYAGQCSSQIPISSVSFDSFMQSVISVGVATATGGAGLAAAGASAALGDARANMAGMAHADVSQYQHESVRANFHKTVVDTQSSIQSATASAIMSAKGQYKHAGAMTGIAGYMGAKKPYLIIKRPNQAIPSDYGFFHGYPSNTKAVLGDLEGYTVVDDIRLNIPEATVEEIIECEKLLKGGIII